MTEGRSPSTAAVVVALLVVYLVWGSTYLGIAVVIQTMPPLLTAGVRYGIAGLIMLIGVVALARLRPGAIQLERPTLAQWRSAVVIGLLLLLGGNGGVVLGELFIPSGIAAVLLAMEPMWLAGVDALITHRRPSALAIGGILAGIIGVAVLVVPVEGLGGFDPIGVGLVLLAGVSWAAGSIYVRHASLPRSGALGTGMEMLAGGGALLIGGILLGEVGRTDVSSFSTESVVALAYLIVFGSIVAFTAYTWLLANVPISVVATYAYVNPVVAVALGALILSEPITPRTLIAGLIIIGAVVAMVSGRTREANNAGAATPIEAD
ncbi:MAG TPA: EamA family transporter [Candidatus Limnocylindria bacterium]|nr:EamA family transporter [Candidatus Limnocylindria bacterium]